MSSLSDYFISLKDEESVTLKVNIHPTVPPYEICLYKNGTCHMINKNIYPTISGFFDIVDNTITFKMNTSPEISTFSLEYSIVISDDNSHTIHFKLSPFSFIISTLEWHSILTSTHPHFDHILNNFGTIHVPNKAWFNATIFHIIVP